MTFEERRQAARHAAWILKVQQVPGARKKERLDVG
jgi:hypothetical protein